MVQSCAIIRPYYVGLTVPDGGLTNSYVTAGLINSYVAFNNGYFLYELSISNLGLINGCVGLDSKPYMGDNKAYTYTHTYIYIYIYTLHFQFDPTVLP